MKRFKIIGKVEFSQVPIFIDAETEDDAWEEAQQMGSEYITPHSLDEASSPDFEPDDIEEVKKEDSIEGES